MWILPILDIDLIKKINNITLDNQPLKTVKKKNERREYRIIVDVEKYKTELARTKKDR